MLLKDSYRLDMVILDEFNELRIKIFRLLDSFFMHPIEEFFNFADFDDFSD